MADYAGAVAAIRSRLEDNWTSTRITYENEQPAEPWPPVDSDGLLEPWVHLEIECDAAPLHGLGQTGNHIFRYEGSIMVHVFTPVGSGTALAEQYAIQIGEIFRRKEFYNSTPGHAVRTEDPYPAEHGGKSDDGNWWSTTMAVDFVYWHRG